MDEKAKKVMSSLQALSSRQECCSRDIMAKALKRLDGDAEVAGEILGRLIEDKYVDDLRYASAFAREKSAVNGWGRIKILAGLSAKGIARATAEEALEGIDQDKAGGKLRKVVDTKRKSLEGDPQIKLKLIRFALSRGYTYEEVAPVVEASLRSL